MILKWLLVLFSAVAATVNDPRDLLTIAASQGIRPHSSASPGVFLYAFTRQGQVHETLVLTAGTVFQTGVLEPESRRCVSLLAAMPFNLGDGAVLKISIADDRSQREAVQLYLDPAHVRAHRAWTPIRFEIPQDMDHFTLRFEVTPGPREDSTADWVGLAAGSEPGCLLAAAKIGQ